jgi:hypothetical protein
VNGDSQIDQADLTIALDNLGRMGDASYGDGDLTGDGNVDLNDLAQLLNEFGGHCRGHCR